MLNFFTSNIFSELDIEVYTMECKSDSNDSLSIENVKVFALEIVRKILPASYDCHFYLAGGCFKSMITKKEPNNIDLWAASEDDRTRLIRQLGGACLICDDGGYHPTVVLKTGLPKINVYFNYPSSLDICLSHFDLVMSCIGVEFDSGKLIDSHVHFEANDDAQNKIVRVVRRINPHKDNLLTLMRMLRYADELSYVVIPETIKCLWRNTYVSATLEKRRELLFSSRLSSEDVPFEYEINRIWKEGSPSETCRSYTAQELEQMKREALSSKNNHPKDRKPIAVYLAGLPGSGKSTVARQALSQLGFDSSTINNMVNLDMDELRKYHAQFMAYLDGSIVSNNREKRLIYKDLIPWFNETSNAEFDIYKKSDSLAQTLLERNLDFILPVHW